MIIDGHSFVICSDCGSVVKSTAKQKHKNFHDQLERAGRDARRADR